MSEEDNYVHIPLTDVTARVHEVDHLRAALEKAPPADERRADRPSHQRANTNAQASQRIVVTLPPGLTLTDTLKGMVLSAVTDYVTQHKDQILAMLVEGVKVEK